MEHVALNVEGMSCNGCVRRLEQGLAKLPGVTIEKVEVGYARLAYDPDKTTMIVIENAIANLGFQIRIAGAQQD
jgi:copper chaperone